MTVYYLCPPLCALYTMGDGELRRTYRRLWLVIARLPESNAFAVTYINCADTIEQMGRVNEKEMRTLRFAALRESKLRRG